jgi:hypothetical protein
MIHSVEFRYTVLYIAQRRARYRLNTINYTCVDL